MLQTTDISKREIDSVEKCFHTLCIISIVVSIILNPNSCYSHCKASFKPVDLHHYLNKNKCLKLGCVQHLTGLSITKIQNTRGEVKTSVIFYYRKYKIDEIGFFFHDAGFWLTRLWLAERLSLLRMRADASSASMCARFGIPGSGWLSDIAAPFSRHWESQLKLALAYWLPQRPHLYGKRL